MAKRVANSGEIVTVDSLVTSREETRAGFIKMAIEKNLMASEYVAEARSLRFLAGKVDRPIKLIDLPDIRKGLLTASGLSEKSLKFLKDEDKLNSIRELVEKFLEPAGAAFPDELVYRYLIHKGDALGGKARNLAGTLGERRFLRTFISVLRLADIKYHLKVRKSGIWDHEPTSSLEVEKNFGALYWQKGGRNRILAMNVRVPLIKKNVDLVILNAIPDEFSGKSNDLLAQNTRYVAVGELKGGIDPAGSDEHWKTANFALNRIRSSFQSLGLNPPTFFIGAAIEKNMASEIVTQLNSRVLNRAANLTSDDQLTSICEWIMNL